MKSQFPFIFNLCSAFFVKALMQNPFQLVLRVRWKAIKTTKEKMKRFRFSEQNFFLLLHFTWNNANDILNTLIHFEYSWHRAVYKVSIYATRGSFTSISFQFSLSTHSYVIHFHRITHSSFNVRS